MSFNDYSKIASSTAIYSKEMGISYLALGLCGESGEVADKIKKIYRDKQGIVSEDDKQSILLELGDVMWYLSNMANELGSSLDEIAELNTKKILKRKENNTLHGHGDNR